MLLRDLYPFKQPHFNTIILIENIVLYRPNPSVFFDLQ